MNAYDLILFPIANDDDVDASFLFCVGMNIMAAISEGPITSRSIEISTDSAPKVRIRGSSMSVAVAAPTKSTKYSLLISLGIARYTSAIEIPAKKKGIEEAR